MCDILRKNKEFQNLIQKIISSKEYQTMKHHRHHVKSNTFDHSVKVAYLCFRHHKRFHMKMDLEELIRGALLHDYYLYDWHDKAPSHRFHGFTHPKRALSNALRKYPNLTRTERDMIRRHMFPLTLIPPKTKGGWLICLYDKIAAISDYLGKEQRHRQTSSVIKNVQERS